jgi:hypothetical protein
VTLHPHRQLDLHNTYTLTVIGTGSGGVTDTSGNRLDDARTGQPGSNDLATVTASNLMLGSLLVPAGRSSWLGSNPGQQRPRAEGPQSDLRASGAATGYGPREPEKHEQRVLECQGRCWDYHVEQVTQ